MDAEKKPTTFKIPMTIEVSHEALSGLLCSALEGGSNYWYRIEKFVKPKRFDTWEKISDDDKPGTYRHLDYPLNPGGALIISDYNANDPEDVKQARLSLRTIKRGCEIMAKKYPRHWADFVGEKYDANTGDVFLQCCLWGELVYG